VHYLVPVCKDLGEGKADPFQVAIDNAENTATLAIFQPRTIYRDQDA